MLYIIGARGCGRETYNLFMECKPTLGDIECVGFLDDKKDALDGFHNYPPIVSTVQDFNLGEDDVFICALGDPKWVKYYTELIESKGGKFISLISPLAYVGPNTEIGTGTQVYAWCYISCDAKIGKNCYFGSFSAIGHDVNIGDNCHFGSHSFVGGRAKIGNNVTIHPRVNIIPDKTIKSDAVLGVGSVVIRNVGEGVTVFGNPAKRIN